MLTVDRTSGLKWKFFSSTTITQGAFAPSFLPPSFDTIFFQKAPTSPTSSRWPQIILKKNNITLSTLSFAAQKNTNSQRRPSGARARGRIPFGALAEGLRIHRLPGDGIDLRQIFFAFFFFSSFLQKGARKTRKKKDLSESDCLFFFAEIQGKKTKQETHRNINDNATISLSVTFFALPNR